MLQVQRQGGSERFLFRARSDIPHDYGKAAFSKILTPIIAFPKIEISVTGVF